VGLIRGATIICTLFKIHWLPAFFTDVFTVELIGKNFFFRAAMVTFTEKRFQISKSFKPRAMTTWSIHSSPPAFI
jgi:hypothetical protein